jgi:hypothetical protein
MRHRMPEPRRPWIEAVTPLHLPIRELRRFETYQFECQSARLLGTNLENPLNVILCRSWHARI